MDHAFLSPTQGDGDPGQPTSPETHQNRTFCKTPTYTVEQKPSVAKVRGCSIPGGETEISGSASSFYYWGPTVGQKATKYNLQNHEK